MTKPGAKKSKASGGGGNIGINWCCPHSAVLKKTATVRRITISQDDKGLHLDLLKKR